MVRECSMKIIVKKLVVVWCVVSICSCVAFGDLSGSIKSIVKSRDCSKADFAIKIIKADTGKTVYELNEHKPMIPASNMKVITTAAGLAYLGKDYKFTTKVGMLGNDLVVIGGGDPLLGDEGIDKSKGRKPGWVFDEIVAKIKEKQIVSFDDIVIDSAFFDDMRVHPNWPTEQLNKPYACEVSGLNYNQNCVRITARNSNGQAIVIVDPSTRYLQLVNKIKLKSSGSSAIGAYRNRTPNLLTLKGKLVKEAGFYLAIENPAAMFGFMLKERLLKEGMVVSGDIVEKQVRADGNISVFWMHETPIYDVIGRCNKDSFNLAAEAMIKTISAEYTAGKIKGEWEHGFELVGKYLENLGIDDDEFTIDDGCGLSRNNKVSPNVFVTVLKSIYDSKCWTDYKSTLAVGGIDGTAYKYFRDPKYKGKVLGKTGYINGVRTFSGVCTASDGDYIFSILTKGGNAKVRYGINDIVEAVIDSN